ncbi:MAG TPA: hypothetical protein VD794_11420, partial [Flavisolibacter sp.]|nr:hypothetical protein [Flavisolibacter sp.]
FTYRQVTKQNANAMLETFKRSRFPADSADEHREESVSKEHKEKPQTKMLFLNLQSPIFNRQSL